MTRLFEMLSLILAILLPVSLLIAASPLFFIYDNNESRVTSFEIGKEIIFAKQLYLYPVIILIALVVCLTIKGYYKKRKESDV